MNASEHLPILHMHRRTQVDPRQLRLMLATLLRMTPPRDYLFDRSRVSDNMQAEHSQQGAFCRISERQAKIFGVDTQQSQTDNLAAQKAKKSERAAYSFMLRGCALRDCEMRFPQFGGNCRCGRGWTTSLKV